MSNIEYISKRLKEIYECYYDDVYVDIVEHEKTYSLELVLKGVNYKRKSFEIDKKIDSVGMVINYICKEMN